MSSVLDALSPAERAEVIEAVQYRRLERALVEHGVQRLLEQELVRYVPVANPGAGADWSVSPPAGSTWELLAVATLFTASAVVATRTTSLRIVDADGTILDFYNPAATTAASQVARHQWQAGLGAPSTTNVAQAMLPDPPPLVESGYTLRTTTASLDVGDAWTQVVLTVRDWNASRVVNIVRALLADLDSAGGIRYLS